MAKFVLGKPVNSFDMTALEADSFEITSSYTVSFTPTTCTAATSAVVQSFGGPGFADPDPVTDAPREGIITSWNLNILGAEIFDFTKMSLSWADFHAYTEANNTEAFLDAIFGGRTSSSGRRVTTS
jgi:hypothetical protein